jgi:hypothetical protein
MTGFGELPHDMEHLVGLQPHMVGGRMADISAMSVPATK